MPARSSISAAPASRSRTRPSDGWSRSASEAKGMLDAYLVGTGAGTTLKSVTPTSSLVTGYEFLTDSSTAVKNQLQLGTGTTPDSLINDTWTADQLRPKLLGGPKKNIVYLAGHFDSQPGLRGRQGIERQRE